MPSRELARLPENCDRSWVLPRGKGDDPFDAEVCLRRVQRVVYASASAAISEFCATQNPFGSRQEGECFKGSRRGMHRARPRTLTANVGLAVQRIVLSSLISRGI